MIGDVLLVLKNQLNDYFRSLSAGAAEGAGEDKVAFIDVDQKGDSATFKTGAISILLYRIEQETAVRPGDPYVRVAADGSSQRVRPDISLNIHVLVVAKFKDYAQGLQYLAEVIRFFQSHKTFDRQNTPELGEGILELAVDLVTMTVQQQNELWGLLRTTYLPSVAYKIRTLTFKDEDAAPPGTAVADLVRRGLT
jgi:hypothetical protein